LHLSGAPPKGGLLALHINIKLGWRGLPGAKNSSLVRTFINYGCKKVLKNKALVVIEKFSRHRHTINILRFSCRWDCQCVTQGTEFFQK